MEKFTSLLTYIIQKILFGTKVEKKYVSLEETLSKSQKIFAEFENDFVDATDKYVESLTEDQREMIVCYVFRKLEKHLEQGGSYRTMVYDLFNLPSSYLTVQISGGIDIHNCIIEKHYENKEK